MQIHHPLIAPIVVLILSAVAPAACTAATVAQSQPRSSPIVEVPMTPEHWARADRMSFVNYLNAPAAMLSGGAYMVANSDVANGRIDVDVAMHGQRGFLGVLFRGQDDSNFEVFYLRPHKSRLPDAIQYTPNINGQSAWQLYGGERYNAAAEMPHNRWVHMAVEFIGREAKVYLDGADTPAMTVDLKADRDRGMVGLWGLNVGHFANFSYRAYDDTPLPPRPSFDAPTAFVDNWSLSEVFEAAVTDPTRTPTQTNWTPVDLEAPGFVNIARWHRKLPQSVRVEPAESRDLVFARTTISARSAGTRKLWIGYSDGMTVLLNGQPIYQGSAAFGERYPFSLGILGMRQDAVFLPLLAGENELVFAVSEVFGGWGFSAEFAE